MTETEMRDRVRLVRALFPDLAGELDEAFAANGGGASDGFDAWLDRETDRLRATTLSSAAFGETLDGAQRARFERAFAAARAVAARIGAAPPQPEAFTAAGVELGRLGAAMAADPSLEPVPAPYGLGEAGWQRLFAHVGEGQGSRPRPGSALVVATEAEREFAALDATPRGEGAATPEVAQAGGLRWTLRLIPAGQRPARLGLGFAHGPHPTLPEMLMLQLMRLERGEEPVDAASFTWLAGSLADGRLAARHVYDAGEGTVRISCREVGSQGPHLGARPPIG